MTIADVIALPEVTPRERQIIERLAGGLTPKEIAFELGVAHATVRVLYARAMKRLERAQLAPTKRSAQP